MALQGNPGTASLTLGGAAAKLALQLNPAAGALGLSTAAASATVGIKPAPGHLAITGYATETIAPQAFTPQPGMLALAGNSPVLVTQAAPEIDYLLVAIGPTMALLPSTATVQYFSQGVAMRPLTARYRIDDVYGCKHSSLDGIAGKYHRHHPDHPAAKRAGITFSVGRSAPDFGRSERYRRQSVLIACRILGQENSRARRKFHFR